MLNTCSNPSNRYSDQDDPRVEYGVGNPNFLTVSVDNETLRI